MNEQADLPEPGTPLERWVADTKKRMYQGSQEAKINALTSEIERLKTEREEWQMRFLSLRTLLTRAADALEGWSQKDVVVQPLIAELREAAK
jgi:hypothetical protein